MKTIRETTELIGEVAKLIQGCGQVSTGIMLFCRNFVLTLMMLGVAITAITRVVNPGMDPRIIVLLCVLGCAAASGGRRSHQKLRSPIA